jgi:hypothetical protein
MSKCTSSRWIAFAVGLLLVFGIARASTSRYVERRNAIFQSLATEQQRLGLTDRVQLFAKYPSPEITLCRAARVAPGATGEVAVSGKFIAGTKFLFENDDVDVVQEKPTASDYHATVRAPSGIGPSVAFLHAFTPVSGGEAKCTALYIGGRYEWEFTAQNGWRIQLHPKEAFHSEGGSSSPVSVYRAEFYRGNESKPFEVRELRLGLEGALYQNSYGGSLQETQETPGNQGSSQADLQKMAQRLSDPSLSAQERAQLMQRLSEASQQMMQQQQGAIQKMSDPNYLQEQQQKQAEFGCQNMNFNLKAGVAEGQIACGQKVGRLPVKGTMRFVGP